MAGTYQTALGLVSDPFGLNSGMVCTGHHQLKKKKKEQEQKDSKKPKISPLSHTLRSRE